MEAFSSSQSNIPTVSAAVSRAATICDPEGADPAVTALFTRYEDDERPATATDLARELRDAARDVDPEGDSPAAQMTASAAAWLATNIARADDHEVVLREAARAAYRGNPPEPIADWLVVRGVEVAS